MDHDINNLLVVCDVDGTLMRAGKPIPERNVEMIAKFRELGGNFTICTGRGIQASRRLIEELGINIPAILCNGGLIYDYGTEKILSQSVLDEEYKELAADFVDRFPEIGYEVVSGNDIYVPQNNNIINQHLYVNNMEYKMMPLEKITAEANKILIGADEDTISRMKMYYNNKRDIVPYYKKFDFTQTSPVYFELMPKGITKGDGLTSLANILGIKQRNTSAIGDFDNDLPMLRAAGTAVVVDNAPDHVKAVADKLVCDCLCGGVGEYLEMLLNM
ncbi:MAG: Cof-type HAD-IIB family hydrolase [Oscillospiraceae bacterium]|nr:Cof-type HAD-IIB family hydrolase [Oscillospiraceae bacterium]